MNESGIWLIALALLLLALFPLFVFVFFHTFLLERISQGLVDDLTNRKAFEIEKIKDQLISPEHVKTQMRTRNSYGRFTGPVLLLVFFNWMGFSIAWDLIRHRFPVQGEVVTILYNAGFLGAAKLPMVAFLGVVVFNYGNMLRRLYARDITTEVFWNALYRTWVVMGVSVVFAVSSTFGEGADSKNFALSSQMAVAYFGLGFIITSVLQGLIDRAQDKFQVKRLKVEQLPLSLIQGINFWHEYRLEEEGIENIQNLATCDIIKLAQTTRYNLRTLLDWVDQAILIHRMGQKAVKLRDTGFISGVIDMAWAAPINNQGDTKLSDQIAKTVEVDAIYISTLMNGLYEDSQVNVLWDLWQSQLDSKNKDKSA